SCVVRSVLKGRKQRLQIPAEQFFLHFKGRTRHASSIDPGVEPVPGNGPFRIFERREVLGQILVLLFERKVQPLCESLLVAFEKSLPLSSLPKAALSPW